MGFAMIMGGAIAGASERLLSILEEFGQELGVALQMFDDLGNVIGKCEPFKRYEDLELYRPSWVWACAANSSTPEVFEIFRGGFYRRIREAGPCALSQLVEHGIGGAATASIGSLSFGL